MTESGTGESGQDVVEVNVGFDGSSGRKATMDVSVSVVRELDSLDVLTVLIPREKRTELENHPEIRYVETNGQAGAFDD
ncbi:hypothetical protein [Haladaptatus caseinilyticus]|uniref:hypothetical protein n=1 Tax=Haladaptatus caseinilyticus TaxID=2993314 RepID=UPI00224AA16D|nr:hypothetical protein [Haladaptatus caseinilyticus]